MHGRKIFILAGIVLLTVSGAEREADVARMLNVLSFGARGDGATLNTTFIQAAIDSAAAMGGGVVVVPAGRFLSGTLVLKSNVELRLRQGASILGSINPADYQHLALILAEGQENISITGKGTIDGQGRKLGLYMDSLFYAGKLDSAHYNLRRKRPENRPGNFKISNCKNVHVSGITVKNACGWVQTYRLCEGLVIDSIRVESDAYWNNDGIDIADCKKVRITHCYVNSADDGICLKSEDGADHWNEDIYIADCTVRSSASAVKFGTTSVGGFKKVRIKNIRVFDTFRSAIALESVDGGDLEDIQVDNIVATNTGDGIFIRLGQRNKGGRTGTLRNVTIKNVKVQIPFDRPDKNYDLRGPDLPFFHNPFPCSITGIPGHPVENVTLENIEISFPGRGNDGLANIPLSRLKDVDENEAGYPEFSMFGELPSWGFYVRHVDGLTMKNIMVKTMEKDFRPAFVFDDVNKLELNNISIGKANDNVPVVLNRVTRSTIQKVITPGFTGNPVKTFL
jgi:polygalacturonase